MKRAFIFHGVPHGILNNRLNQKRRNLNVFASLIDMLGLLDTFFSKTSLLNCQIPACLCQFLRKRNKCTLRTLKRAAIKHRELAKQVTCLIGVCARKRCNGIKRIEQEVWINLCLQGLDLGSSGQLCLTVKLVRGKLSGEKLAQTLCDCQLRAINFNTATIIELDSANRAVLNNQRDNDAKGAAAIAKAATPL